MIGDFIYDNPGWTLLIVVGAFLTIAFLGASAAFLGASASLKEEKRLIAQCLADGRKEYECRAMFKRDTTTVVPMPVVIHR